MHEHVKLSLVCQEQCKYNMLLRGLESMEAMFDGGFKDRRQLGIGLIDDEILERFGAVEERIIIQLLFRFFSP